MKLTPLISKDLMRVSSELRTRDEALAAIAEIGHERYPAVTTEVLLEGLHDRESKYPTGTPEGVAFPHVLLPQITPTSLVVLLMRPGVRWSDQAHPPQDLVFGILGNAEAPWEHVRLLARLARIIRGPGALERLRACADPVALYQTLTVEDQRHG